MYLSSERVLVLASSQKDAESTCFVLSQGGVESTKCFSIEDLQSQISIGAGAVILAKEVLTTEYIQKFSEYLSKQPKWSFLPIILLIGAGDLSLPHEDGLKLLKPLRNTTFLERPVRVGILLSVVQSALADRRRQYELRKLLDALEESKIEAVEANKAKSAFLANMSHEIRTPLGAILGFSGLLSEPSLDKNKKENYLLAIERNGLLLSALIDDILDLAKVEAGRISLESIDISLHELISEVVSVLGPKASSKNIGLNFTWEKEVPKYINTDPVRLKQILINIIGNAIKFTNTGKVVVRFFTNDKLLHFQVTDTGVGITAQQMQDLFQPFAQADSSITRKFGGTGLGLVLSKKLAMALGGDLTLKDSKPGHGSTFEISIDISKPVTNDSIQSITSTSKKSYPDFTTDKPLKNRRILLVDDSKDNQILISSILGLSGAIVETADDGEAGVETALGKNFDVILMDVQMPKLGGREAAHKLRQEGYKLPIIALTAHALKEDRDKCLEAGCDNYLTKPVQRNELIQTIMSYCQSPNSPLPTSLH